MDYLKGAPQQIFAPLLSDILDDKPKDIETWMITWMRRNKVKLKKALINIPRDEPDSESEDEEERNERLRRKAERMGTHEIIEEDEESEAESFGRGDPDPEPNF